jgi:phosphatidylserine/phosphatidylglycerophosphate/cardiolipin synthase-like enzyme
VIDAAERREALVEVIGRARSRLVLSLFRCDDRAVLDALAAALERGVEVRALLTKRAKGGKKGLKKLWGALEDMGAVVSWYADPVVKYHAKYLVADDGPAVVATLNPTRKCFTRTWDCLLVSRDSALVRSLLALFEADTANLDLPGTHISRRLIVGPERARDHMHRIIGGAKRSIRILDHKLSDPEVMAILRERRLAGVDVTVLGRHPMGKLRPHGKMLVVDGRKAIIGSMALSAIGLDFRREVSVIIENASMVRLLDAAFDALRVHAGGRASTLPGDRR